MPTFAQQFLPRFQALQQELLDRLALLVNIDSGTSQQEGILQVQTHLQNWLLALGFEVTLHKTDRFGPNLLARLSGHGKGRLLIVGHVDTVYPPGSASIQPFQIRVDRAYGPGVTDMKSGVLMGLYALRLLLEDGFDQFEELLVIFNNDEEVSSPGSTPLLREIASTVDAALVLEPSRSSEFVTLSRKGTDKYQLEVTGIPSHSGGEPHKGRSAVLELAHKIIAIQNLHPLLPGTTLNITRLSSSELLNVTPDQARCWISVRAFTASALEQAADALTQVAAQNFVPGTQTRLTRNRGRIPYIETPELSRLFDIARAEAAAVDIQLEGECKGGVSDANTLMDVGVPALDGLGPIGTGMHDLNREYLDLKSLARRGALLAGLIQSFCLSKSTGQ